MAGHRARRRPDPAREVEALHAGAGADAALGDRITLGRDRVLDVARHDRPRVGEVAVVALTHHRHHDVLRAASRRGDRRLIDGADRVRAAEVDRRLHVSDLVDLELRGELARPVDDRHSRRSGQAGRRHNRHPGTLAALGLGVTHPDPGHVGDRVPRPGLEPADRPRDVAPALSASPSWPAAAAVPLGPASGRAAGRPRAGRARPPASAPGPPGRTGSKRCRAARMEAAARRHRRSRRAARRESSSRSPPPPGVAPAPRHERLGVGVLRALDHVRTRPLLDDPPEVHHAIRSHSDQARLRSWVMKSSASSRCFWRSNEHPQDLRLDRGVEHRDRLVADQAIRLEDERGRDRDPLALTAGELVRVALEESFGVEPDVLERASQPCRRARTSTRPAPTVARRRSSARAGAGSASGTGPGRSSAGAG